MNIAAGSPWTGEFLQWNKRVPAWVVIGPDSRPWDQDLIASIIE